MERLNMKTMKLLVAGLLLAGTGLTAQAAQYCEVADPSTTPLNVRNVPNQSKSSVVLGTLENGTEVRVRKHSKDKKWVYVSWSKGDQPLNKWSSDKHNKGRYHEGWVYRKYLAGCYNQ